jgi:hypothetical protein
VRNSEDSRGSSRASLKTLTGHRAQFSRPSGVATRSCDDSWVSPYDVLKTLGVTARTSSVPPRSVFAPAALGFRSRSAWPSLPLRLAFAPAPLGIRSSCAWCLLPIRSVFAPATLGIRSRCARSSLPLRSVFAPAAQRWCADALVLLLCPFPAGGGRKAPQPEQLQPSFLLGAAKAFYGLTPACLSAIASKNHRPMEFHNLQDTSIGKLNCATAVRIQHTLHAGIAATAGPDLSFRCGAESAARWLKDALAFTPRWSADASFARRSLSDALFVFLSGAVA